MSDVHAALTAQAELLDALLEPEPPRRRWWGLVVLALVVVVAAAGAGVFVLSERGPAGPPHPSAWDPKVKKYVDFVEDHRHLEFTHPVYVDFLSPAEFEKQVTADRGELSGDDLEEIDQAAGTLRALGAIKGDVDLFDKSNQLRAAGIIGFYSYQDERLRIRGTTITPAVESTIVHELTHAVQDQSFDLGRRFEELSEADDADGSAAASGFDALVEGDARRVEGLWRDSLGKKARAALDQEQRRTAKEFERGTKDIPDVLVTLLAAPYDLGQGLLAAAVQQGGDGAVDDLFRSPPKTEEQQLDPWTLLADHQGQLTVPEPDPPEGAKAFDDGDFGSLGWLILLSERLPADRALTAADGWGGDAFTAYDQDGTSCVKLIWRGDTAEDLTQMQAALEEWVNRGPKGAASLERQDHTLALTSCDPGKAAPRVPRGATMDAVRLALSRTYLSLQLVKGGLEPPMARCGADRLVREFTLAELNSPHADKQRVLQTIQPCRREV